VVARSRARGLVFEFASHLPQVLRFLQQLFDDPDHRLAGFVTAMMRLPCRTKISTPSSPSSSRICFDTRAGSVQLFGGFREVQPCLTVSRTYLNCWKFMVLSDMFSGY